ncbi:hypothetical protein Lal_00033199 [Lupinus albus]|nr:hypothetical protein Lal_00043706 [Lupinus albus]KAF1876902.1 hypothetical protein Lal_00033199 [Lupinus albus]
MRHGTEPLRRSSTSYEGNFELILVMVNHDFPTPRGKGNSLFGRLWARRDSNPRHRELNKELNNENRWRVPDPNRSGHVGKRFKSTGLLGCLRCIHHCTST